MGPVDILPPLPKGEQGRPGGVAGKSGSLQGFQPAALTQNASSGIYLRERGPGKAGHTALTPDANKAPFQLPRTLVSITTAEAAQQYAPGVLQRVSMPDERRFSQYSLSAPF